MAKILFVFGGTGDTAKNNHSLEDFDFNEDVVRVYFNGCQDKAIGGSYVLGQLSPNLDIAAQNARDCFDKDGNLSISALKKKFGNSIIIEPTVTEDVVPVDNINLTGFSRGAVTTFSVARHLDDLGKPIRLFAVDPVPGDSLSGAKKTDSEFHKNQDLRGCKNIERAEVLVSQCRSEVNYFHDTYFKQMAPYFSPECDSHVYRVPKKNHVSACGIGFNQQIDFLISTGCCANKAGYVYSEKKDPEFFLPKFLTQVHHAGNAHNTELLPRYRQKLISLLENKGWENVEQLNVKTAQALYALEQAPASTSKESLQDIVLNDKTNRGKLMREFIVEFENMNQHVLRKSLPEVKDSKAMNEIREAFYKQLLTIHASPTLSTSGAGFASHMHSVIKSLKSELPSKEYTTLKSMCDKLLAKMVPDSLSDEILDKLDESEPLQPRAREAKTHEGPGVESSEEVLITAQRGVKERLASMTSSAHAEADDNLKKQVENEPAPTRM